MKKIFFFNFCFIEKILAFPQKYVQDRKLTRGATRRGNSKLKKLINIFMLFLLLKLLYLQRLCFTLWGN